MHKHKDKHRHRSRSREKETNNSYSSRKRNRSFSPARKHSHSPERGYSDSSENDRNKRYKRKHERREKHYRHDRHKHIKQEPITIKTEPVSPDAKKKNEPKEKPNFGLSGTLAEDTNIYNGILVKYSEPVEARKPKRRWRLYPFKGDDSLPLIPIHRQSAYLLGRERRVADIPIDHPSCSKQHAALQFRLVKYKRDDGTEGQRVRPYIIDLESANGTYVNNNKIEPKRYVELMEKDVIKFGYSTREYVLLHEESKDEELDDNVIEEDNPAEEPKE